MFIHSAAWLTSSLMPVFKCHFLGSPYLCVIPLCSSLHSLLAVTCTHVLVHYLTPLLGYTQSLEYPPLPHRGCPNRHL